MMNNKPDVGAIDTEQLERIDTTNHDEKPSAAYVGDITGPSHKKSKYERRLVLKADLIIVPLAAFIYFSSYLVGVNIQIVTVDDSNLSLGSKQHWQCETHGPSDRPEDDQ